MGGRLLAYAMSLRGLSKGDIGLGMIVRADPCVRKVGISSK